MFGDTWNWLNFVQVMKCKLYVVNCFPFPRFQTTPLVVNTFSIVEVFNVLILKIHTLLRVQLDEPAEDGVGGSVCLR